MAAAAATMLMPIVDDNAPFDTEKLLGAISLTPGSMAHCVLPWASPPRCLLICNPQTQGMYTFKTACSGIQLHRPNRTSQALLVTQIGAGSFATWHMLSETVRQPKSVLCIDNHYQAW